MNKWKAPKKVQQPQTTPVWVTVSIAVIGFVAVVTMLMTASK